MTGGSLFSGIGGLDIALERCGVTVRWQCESSPFCRAVLRRHWPGLKIYDDITTTDFRSTEPVHVLFGGFPCQDVSSAGRRVGLGGRRSGLWREFARAAREARPGIVIVENVASGLPRYIGEVLGDLADLGFDAEWLCIEAANAGASHRRSRWFALAYSDREQLRLFAERIAQADAPERRDSEPGEYGPGVPPPRGHVADGDVHGREGFREGRQVAELPSGHDDARCRQRVPFPPGPRAPRDEWLEWFACGGATPGVLRSTYGAPTGVDTRRRKHRLHALGNAVVPAQAELAIRTLAARAWGMIERRSHNE